MTSRKCLKEMFIISNNTCIHSIATHTHTLIYNVVYKTSQFICYLDHTFISKHIIVIFILMQSRFSLYDSLDI